MKVGDLVKVLSFEKDNEWEMDYGIDVGNVYTVTHIWDTEMFDYPIETDSSVSFAEHEVEVIS